MTTVEELIIEHYGVKGQKWGVRRRRGSGGRVSDDHREVRELTRKPTSQLSNEQIRKANDRLTLEQNFNRMNADTVKRGHLKTKELLGIAATAVTVYNMVHSPAGQAAIRAGKAFIGPSLRAGVKTIGK